MYASFTYYYIKYYIQCVLVLFILIKYKCTKNSVDLPQVYSLDVTPQQQYHLMVKDYDI